MSLYIKLGQVSSGLVMLSQVMSG